MRYTILIKIRRCFMGIVYQKDKRTGTTYVYENQSFWDKELKRSRSKRKLIGKLNEDGEIVPTDGRCKKLSPSYVPKEDEYQMPKTMKEMRAEILRLLDENAALKKQLEELRK